MALGEKIPNWPAPPTWTPTAGAGAGGVKTGFATTYSALPFIPVTPCRVADTRAGSGFPAGYGPPSMPGVHAQRSFTFWGQCGIPTNASAVSLNFAIWAPVTRGDIRVFPAGDPVPTAATLNWEAGIQALANAAVAALSAAGAITVQVDGPGTIDLIIDVNGYYSTNVSAAAGQELRLTSSGVNTIYAINSSADGTAITGLATGTGSSSGVFGWSTGTGATATGVHGYVANGFAGVWGVSTTGNGVRGQSTSSIGVYGASTSNYGVYGTSGSSHGVVGSAGGTAVVFGVHGENSSGATAGTAGVHGTNRSAASRAAAVRGDNAAIAQNNLSGVLGITRGGTNIGSSVWIEAGVRGEGSGSTYGVFGVSHYKSVKGAKYNSSTGLIEAEGILAFKPGSTAYAVYGETGDFGGTGAKYFVEPHATDPSKVIRYISLEGPESGTYFRGRAATSGGIATIEVPDHFRMVSDEEGMTVHVTPVGHFAQIWIESRDLNQIVVRSGRDVEFDYIVHGVRRAFRNFNPIDESPEFMPESAGERMRDGWPAEIKARLVRIGIYNPDGTVNMQTAERLGWAQKWREEEQLRPSPSR